MNEVRKCSFGFDYTDDVDDYVDNDDDDDFDDIEDKIEKRLFTKKHHSHTLIAGKYFPNTI